jgi:hypothetical protein
MAEQDKTPVTENGYRISFNGKMWQAVKEGLVRFIYKDKNAVITWAKNN